MTPAIEGDRTRQGTWVITTPDDPLYGLGHKTSVDTLFMPNTDDILLEVDQQRKRAGPIKILLKSVTLIRNGLSTVDSKQLVDNDGFKTEQSPDGNTLYVLDKTGKELFRCERLGGWDRLPFLVPTWEQT